MTDYIKREDINKLLNDLSFVTRTVIYNRTTGHTLEDILEHDFSELPSADVVEVEKILAAGKEGKEARIYIGGRLFAIREVAQ